MSPPGARKPTFDELLENLLSPEGGTCTPPPPPPPRPAPVTRCYCPECAGAMELGIRPEHAEWRPRRVRVMREPPELAVVEHVDLPNRLAVLRVTNRRETAVLTLPVAVMLDCFGDETDDVRDCVHAVIGAENNKAGEGRGFFIDVALGTLPLPS